MTFIPFRLFMVRMTFSPLAEQLLQTLESLAPTESVERFINDLPLFGGVLRW